MADRHEAQAVGPALVVVPFRGLSGGEGGQLLVDGLTNGLITALLRFDALRVFAASKPDQQGRGDQTLTVRA